MKFFILVLYALLFSMNAYSMGGKNKIKDVSPDVVAFPHGGGSNLVFLDIGKYAQDRTRWSTDVKVTLLHYKKYRSVVKKRLAKMSSEGQTKLGVVLWYVEDGKKCKYFSHVVCPQKGKVSEEVQDNIKYLIEDMNAYKFDTLVFRFAAQGEADPLSEDYQIHRINDSWNLFEETYKVVEAARKGKKVKVLYDLGLETMGHPYSNRQGAQEFLYTMWNRYAAEYPMNKTVGFSFNHVHDKAVDQSLNVYRSSGKWPSAVAVDIYADPDKYLGNLSGALKRAGKPGYPVIVTETFYNSEEMARRFRNNKFRVNFQFVLQWPLAKDSDSPHVSNPETIFISAYIKPNTANVATNNPGITPWTPPTRIDRPRQSRLKTIFEMLKEAQLNKEAQEKRAQFLAKEKVKTKKLTLKPKSKRTVIAARPTAEKSKVLAKVYPQKKVIKVIPRRIIERSSIKRFGRFNAL